MYGNMFIFILNFKLKIKNELFYKIISKINTYQYKNDKFIYRKI